MHLNFADFTDEFVSLWVDLEHWHELPNVCNKTNVDGPNHSHRINHTYWAKAQFPRNVETLAALRMLGHTVTPMVARLFAGEDPYWLI